MILMGRARLTHVLSALIGLSASVAFADHGQEPDADFKIPRAELLSTIKKIGVMPIRVPAEVPDADGVSARYEAEIVARLTSAGFVVTPPSAMREIRERTKATLGGLYDPMTGRPIQEKVVAFNEFSDNEYLASHQVDALIQPAIVVRSVDFSSDKASWDGVTDSSSGRSGVADFMMSMSGAGVRGQIPALSLSVRLADIRGKLLYTAAGGLQVLAYERAGVEHMLATTQQRYIDAKFIMTDPARDARALSLALDPLLLGSVPASTKIASAPAAGPDATGAALQASRDAVLAHFPRVALAPLDLGEIEQHEEVGLRYRESLMEKLAQLGFKVVGGEDYGRLWDAERVAAGGYFDPFTGKLDESKVKASRQRVFELMQDHLMATAVMIPRIIVRCAPFHSGAAEWDGIRESLIPGKSKLGAVFDSRFNYGGGLSAISLEVSIIDPVGEPALDGIGGIQLIERVSEGGRRPLARSETFADPAKDVRAVDIALTTLAPTGRAHRSDCAGSSVLETMR